MAASSTLLCVLQIPYTLTLNYSGACWASAAPLNVTGNHPREEGDWGWRENGRKEKIMENARVVRPDAKRRHTEEEDWGLEASKAWRYVLQLS